VPQVAGHRYQRRRRRDIEKRRIVRVRKPQPDWLSVLQSAFTARARGGQLSPSPHRTPGVGREVRTGVFSQLHVVPNRVTF